jgi:antitoxin (DNA-binding transcriptional repressor) of toxin-antitoxin stability system
MSERVVVPVVKMVYLMVMKKVNVNEAKTHLSALIAEVSEGNSVVICRRNVPAAELRPIPTPRRTRRPIGLATRFAVPASFFEPLPDEVLDSFGERRG